MENSGKGVYGQTNVTLSIRCCSNTLAYHVHVLWSLVVSDLGVITVKRLGFTENIAKIASKAHQRVNIIHRTCRNIRVGEAYGQADSQSVKKPIEVLLVRSRPCLLYTSPSPRDS